MADKIQLRRDIAANWTSANPILAQGEVGIETDTLKLKIGDGSTVWSSLAYILAGSVSDKINDYQVTNADFEKVLTMNYATLKTFTLPTSANIAAYLGQRITFVKKGAGKVVIQAGATQFIADSSSAGTIYNDQTTETYATIVLVAISTTQWVIVGFDGTWTAT